MVTTVAKFVTSILPSTTCLLSKLNDSLAEGKVSPLLSSSFDKLALTPFCTCYLLTELYHTVYIPQTSLQFSCCFFKIHHLSSQFDETLLIIKFSKKSGLS